MSDTPSASDRAAPSPAAAGSVGLLLALTFYAQYIVGTRGLVAPFLRTEFALDDTGITFLQGVVSLGALATFVLSWWADRRGRRRVVLASFVALPLTCAATAIAPGVATYAALQVVAAGFNGALLAILTVMVSEVAIEERRASAQAWFGVVTALGAGGFLFLGPLLADIPGTWRWAFALGVLPLLAAPLVLRRLPESHRFERAAASGRVETTRGSDLFRGAYRRRAIGMIAATTLRPIALIALLAWHYDHALNAMEFSAGTGSLIMLLGGAISFIGYPLGVRFSNEWGRRPTLLAFATLGIAGGIAYYWIPAGPGAAFWMGVCFTVEQIGLHAFGVADRCLDTEAFPTALRGTYTGWTRVAMAIASIVTQFSLSGITLVSGRLLPPEIAFLGLRITTEGLPLAITLLCVVSFVPSIFFFLWGAPETKGLLLDEAALEGEPAA